MQALAFFVPVLNGLRQPCIFLLTTVTITLMLINVSIQKRQTPYKELRKTLRRHRGTLAAIARCLGVTQPAIHNWLAQRLQSENIHQAVRWFALVIRTAEHRHAARTPAEWRAAIAEMEQRYKQENG